MQGAFRGTTVLSNLHRPPRSPHSIKKEWKKKTKQKNPLTKQQKNNPKQGFCFPSKVTSAQLYIQQSTKIAVLGLRRDFKNTIALQNASGDHES